MANTKRMNRLEELGRVDSEKAFTKKGKRNLKAEKKRIVKEVSKKNMGGSMGGGMNPMGYSKDPTIRSVTGYNPNRPMMRKKGGAIKRRGGGIAKRGMGIAK